MRRYFLEAYSGGMPFMTDRLYKTLDTAWRAADKMLGPDGFDKVVIREIASSSIKNPDEQIYVIQRGYP